MNTAHIRQSRPDSDSSIVPVNHVLEACQPQVSWRTHDTKTALGRSVRRDCPCLSWEKTPGRERKLPTETKVESGTSQSNSATSVKSSNNGNFERCTWGTRLPSSSALRACQSRTRSLSVTDIKTDPRHEDCRGESVRRHCPQLRRACLSRKRQASRESIRLREAASRLRAKTSVLERKHQSSRGNAENVRPRTKPRKRFLTFPRFRLRPDVFGVSATAVAETSELKRAM